MMNADLEQADGQQLLCVAGKRGIIKVISLKHNFFSQSLRDSKILTCKISPSRHNIFNQ